MQSEMRLNRCSRCKTVHLQMILMKYALYIIFEKKTAIFKLSSAAYCRWVFMGEYVFSGIPLVTVCIQILTVSLDLNLN